MNLQARPAGFEPATNGLEILTCGFLQVVAVQLFVALTSFAAWTCEPFYFRRFHLLSVAVWVKRGTFL
jgi:hypothetical protein